MQFDNRVPRRGERRVHRHFCFIPITFDNITYWLEFINLKQVWVHALTPYGANRSHWRTVGKV